MAFLRCQFEVFRQAGSVGYKVEGKRDDSELFEVELSTLIFHMCTMEHLLGLCWVHRPWRWGLTFTSFTRVVLLSPVLYVKVPGKISCEEPC